MCMVDRRPMAARYGEHNHFYSGGNSQQQSARGDRGRHYPPAFQHRPPPYFDGRGGDGYHRRPASRDAFPSDNGRRGGGYPANDHYYRPRYGHGGPSTSADVFNNRADSGGGRRIARAAYKSGAPPPNKSSSYVAALSAGSSAVAPLTEDQTAPPTATTVNVAAVAAAPVVETKRHTSQEKKSLAQFGDWQEFLSSSGKKYFYNVKTEVSKWEKPKEWADHELAQTQPQTVAPRRQQSANVASANAVVKKPLDGWRQAAESGGGGAIDHRYLQYLDEFEDTTDAVATADHQQQRQRQPASADERQTTPVRRGGNQQNKRTVADVSPLSNDSRDGGVASPSPSSSRRRAALTHRAALVTADDHQTTPVRRGANQQNKRTVADVSPLSNDSRDGGLASPSPSSSRRRDALAHRAALGVFDKAYCDTNSVDAPSTATASSKRLDFMKSAGDGVASDSGSQRAGTAFINVTRNRSIKERQYRMDEESNGDAESMQCSPSCSSGGDAEGARAASTGGIDDGDGREGVVTNGDDGGHQRTQTAIVDRRQQQPMGDEQMYEDERDGRQQAEEEMEEEEEEDALPELSLAHTMFYAPGLTTHVTGWNAEQFENQAWFIFGQSCEQLVKLSHCSTELKTGRSLVRSAEISATLLDCKVAFAAKQCQSLNPSPMKSASSSQSRSELR